MALPVSSVVNVVITTTPVAPSRAGFGTLMFVTSDVDGPIDTTTRSKLYTDPDSVGLDWPSNSEVVVAANTYFAQSPRPTTFKVGFWDKDNTETITDALTNINDFDSDFYCITLEKTSRDDTDVEDAATWTEARIKIFMTASNDSTVLDATTTDIAATLRDASLRRSSVVYSSNVDLYPDVSAFGRAATVDFNAPNSAITLKFKQLPTITVEAINSSQKVNLDSKNANAYISVGGNPMYAESFMANGSFMDEIHGVDWLQNAIETNVFTRLYTEPTKVPYTDKGSTTLEQQVINALNESVSNNLVAPGEDADGNFLPQGFITSVVPVADTPQSNVDARQGPPISFTALLAGAIHGIQVNGLVIR